MLTSLSNGQFEGGNEDDVITYIGAISACGKGEQWHQALSLLQETQSANVIPNVSTYSAAISACENCGQL